MFETKDKKTKAVNKVNVAIGGLTDAIVNLEKAKSEIDAIVTSNKDVITKLKTENKELETSGVRAEKIAKNIGKLLEV